ncbi:MAG: hypothetical protein J5625_04180 [Lachnospiraceae bacterium]|nr:hypothetical protein [Lachnospiraceae bacterium]
MKIVKMRCPSCGALLKTDEMNKKGICEHCGMEVFIDDEVQHIQYDNVEEAGYKFEKGRIKAQEEKITEEREARERAEKEKAFQKQQELARIRAEQEQRRIANQGRKSKKSKVILIVTLSLLGLILFIIFFCCLGIILFPSPSGNGTSNTNQSNGILSQTIKRPVSSIDEIDDAFINELKAKADDELKSYVETYQKDEVAYKDLIDESEYLGECFTSDGSKENELYFIYKINNTLEAIDNVNLRKYTKERNIFYYVGYKNIVVKDDGSFEYDESVVNTPSNTISDFAAKKMYQPIFYQYNHPGYMFISDLFEVIEGQYSIVEYNPGKDVLLKDNHSPTYDMTFYSDNFEHVGVVNYDSYTDASGEVYNDCQNYFYHNAFTDPVCVDYYVGSEYDTLSFTYTSGTTYFGDNTKIHFVLIDKDTFETFYESEDVVKGQSTTVDVDISNHKNIRMQLKATEGNVVDVYVKDVLLSNQ